MQSCMQFTRHLNELYKHKTQDTETYTFTQKVNRSFNIFKEHPQYCSPNMSKFKGKFRQDMKKTTRFIFSECQVT